MAKVELAQEGPLEPKDMNIGLIRPGQCGYSYHNPAAANRRLRYFEQLTMATIKH